LDQELEQLAIRISSLSVSKRDPEEVEDNKQVKQEEFKYQSDKEDQRSLSQTLLVEQPRMSGPCIGTPAPRITQTAPKAPAMETGGHKSTVPEPGWFDGNRRTFEDWWRAMRLYLKANRITGAEDKVTVVLSRFRGGTTGAFAQHKLDEIEEQDDTLSWDAFEAEIKLIYQDKTREADAEWCIEMFIQGRKHIANFLIKFMALVAKAQTDNQHAIFLLKKNVNREIIRAILTYLPKEAPQMLEQWKVAITAVGQGYEWTSIQYDYQTRSGITYGGMGKPMEIEQGKQLKYTRKCCYNCNKEGHIARYCPKE